MDVSKGTFSHVMAQLIISIVEMPPNETDRQLSTLFILRIIILVSYHACSEF